ncbi:MAG: hypothetical protein K9G62_04060 [Alphaproteobacteria bacterium]|nr:hypothetical protein [Alphaproteobacteria bacterium]
MENFIQTLTQELGALTPFPSEGPEEGALRLLFNGSSRYSLRMDSYLRDLPRRLGLGNRLQESLRTLYGLQNESLCAP